MRKLFRSERGVWQSNLLQHRHGPTPCFVAADVLVGDDGLRQLFTNPKRRRERGQGVLKHHGQPIPTQLPHGSLGQRHEVLAVDADDSAHDPASRPEQAQNGQRHRALAGARLAYQAYHLAGLDREGDVFDSANQSMRGGELGP